MPRAGTQKGRERRDEGVGCRAGEGAQLTVDHALAVLCAPVAAVWADLRAARRAGRVSGRERTRRGRVHKAIHPGAGARAPVCGCAWYRENARSRPWPCPVPVLVLVLVLGGAVLAKRLAGCRWAARVGSGGVAGVRGQHSQ